MTRYGETRKSLGKHKLAPKKRFGQNFLVHKHTAEAIVRAGRVTADDVIVEVGVGLGALTQPLAEQAKQVIGVEIDSGIIRFHQEENDLPANVTLIHADVLKADFQSLAEQCGGPMKIMANLPYSISNPFIFKLIENRIWVRSATIMLQKEVAERLMAAPCSKDYGVPSVLLQSCATITALMTLKPKEFHPQPKIDSTVIRIEFDHGPFQTRQETPFAYPVFQRIVRSTFNQRRKTIHNTLSGAGFFMDSAGQDKGVNKKLTEEAITEAGLKPTLRPEVLTVEQFRELAVSFEKRLKQKND